MSGATNTRRCSLFPRASGDAGEAVDLAARLFEYATNSRELLGGRLGIWSWAMLDKVSVDFERTSLRMADSPVALGPSFKFPALGFWAKANPRLK